MPFLSHSKLQDKLQLLLCSWSQDKANTPGVLLHSNVKAPTINSSQGSWHVLGHVSALISSYSSPCSWSLYSTYSGLLTDSGIADLLPSQGLCFCPSLFLEWSFSRYSNGPSFPAFLTKPVLVTLLKITPGLPTLPVFFTRCLLFPYNIYYLLTWHILLNASSVMAGLLSLFYS